MVRPMESSRENTKQPGMKRTCARRPGRLVNKNTA